MKRIKYIYILFFTAILTACGAYTSTVNNRNVSYLYKPNASTIFPQYKIFHESDTGSYLITKIIPAQLLFNRANVENHFLAKLKISYAVFPSYDDNIYLDSGTVDYIIEKENIDKEISSYIKFTTKDYEKCIIKITATDVLRESTNRQFLEIDKSDKNNRQHFFTLSQEDDFPYFRDYFRSDELLKVKHASGKMNDLYIKYYASEIPLVPPPFSLSLPFRPDFAADTVWHVKNIDELDFQLHYQGMYHFQLDSSKTEGLTLFNFGNSFPQKLTATQLLEPLQYLTSSKEFGIMQNSDTVKLAVDEFWLKSAGNINRAKELIRIYYSRILFSNLYFTSYTEGWRTDRGMIYTIFGPPENVYRDNMSEKWIYGQTRDTKTMTFTFQKRRNQFSDQHYVLQRNISYKNEWYKAVDTWRNGRVFFVAQN